MKVVIDIPNYNLDKVQNGSIASKVILTAVRNGKPYEERPHGEWVFDKDGYFSCSCCKLKPHYQVAPTHYCPNCGAKMKV